MVMKRLRFAMMLFFLSLLKWDITIISRAMPTKISETAQLLDRMAAMIAKSTIQKYVPKDASLLPPSGM